MSTVEIKEIENKGRKKEAYKTFYDLSCPSKAKETFKVAQGESFPESSGHTVN